MSESVVIDADLTPVAKSRPRVSIRGGRPHAYTPKKTADYEAALAAVCPAALIQGPVKIIASFTMPTPKSWSKARRAAAIAGSTMPTGTPDLDNLLKAAMDAIEGRAYENDSQVVQVHSAMQYGESGRVHLTVTPA